MIPELDTFRVGGDNAVSEVGIRVLVTGGRDFNQYVALYDVMDEISETRGPIRHVIIGGAPGADYWAESWAFMNLGENRFTVMRADWNAHGRAAGPIRNQRMLDEGKPDLVIAFPGGRGTADMVRRAKAAGVEVIEARTIAARWRPSWENEPGTERLRERLKPLGR